jgi:hypothetical protein
MKVSLETKKRTAQLVEKSGLGIGLLAKKIGTSYSTLWNFLYGDTRNFGKIQELADELGLSLYQLTTKNLDDNAARLATASDRAKGQSQTILTPPSLPKTPVYQSNLADDATVISGEAAEHVSRIIGDGVSKVFAVKVKGDSMSPRYHWGEIVHCGYAIWPNPGDDCVVELESSLGYLKIYVGEKEGDYVFRQLNSAAEWRQPIAAVKAIHKVIGRG